MEAKNTAATDVPHRRLDQELAELEEQLRRADARITRLRQRLASGAGSGDPPSVRAA